VERERIEQLKWDEKVKEERNLFESMERLEKQKWSARDNIDKVINDDAAVSVRSDDDSETILDNSKDVVGGPPTPTVCKSSTDILFKRLPQPRSRKVAKMILTPRIFYTPMRESTKKMEQEFIIKNRHYLKNNQLLNRHALHQYDFEECSPLWLKAKGDEFYRNRDYLSAINAYTHAFEHGLFVEGSGGGEATVTDIHIIANRAACYLQLGESQRCVQDCDYALNKMKNKDEREKYFTKETDALTFEHKLISRLCAAQCQLGNFHDALSILKQQAFTMNSNGIKEQWHQDIKAVTLWYESSLLKNKADMKLSEGSLDDAQELYTKALVLQPSMVSALANRSAFHMAKRNFSLCIQDCNAAAVIIDEEKNPKRNRPFPLFSSSKCLEWKVTITLRRCAAKEMTKDFKGALSDIESVIALLGCSSFQDSLENKRESLMKLQQVQ
jgi:tetratricopeptide (TPR) repeat protein